MASLPDEPRLAIFALALVTLTAVWGGRSAFGQQGWRPADQPQQAVMEVRIVGNEQFPAEKIVRHIHTRPGRPYDPEVVEEDVRRLMHTRMFVDVRPFVQQVSGGYTVIFEVRERKVLEYVKFVGCQKIRRSVLAKEVGLKAGDPFDRFAVAEGRRKLEEFYRAKGFPKVFVTIHEGENEADRGAVYVIDEGPRPRHLWTRFVGNTFASDQRLLTLVKSKPGLVWVFGGKVDPKQIDEDRNRLTAYYRSMGFFQAEVGRELRFTEDENWLLLTFVIHEGPRYQVRNVNVLGNAKFSTEQLTRDLKLRPGKYFNQNEMLADQAMMQDIYGSEGYVFAEVKPDPRFLEEPGKLDIVYNIVEGACYRVGKINVRIDGEYPHTRITTVLNRLSLRPGDILDVRELRASERRLRASQLFAVDPIRNVYPRISFTRPAPQHSQQHASMVEQPRSAGTHRGQSPEAEPYRAYRPIEPNAPGPQGRIVDVDVQIEGQWNPDYVWPDEQAPGRSPTSPPGRPVIRGQSPDEGQPEGLGGSGSTDRPLVPVGEESSPASEPPAGASASRKSHLRWLPGPQDGAGPAWRGLPAKAPPPAGVWPQPEPSTRTQTCRRWPLEEHSGQGGFDSRPRDRVVYRGQAGTYDANEGYSVPLWTEPQPSGSGLQIPQRSLEGKGTVPPEAPGPVLPGPTNPLRPEGPSWPGGDFVPRPPYYGSQATIDDALPLLGNPPSEQPPLYLPLEPILEETTTGRFIFSVGVNSDLGLLGSVIIDEQNFDWSRWPRRCQDILNGVAFRGAGQRFRFEAMPGTRLHRYTISFTEPYLLDTPLSLGLSAYFFDRRFREWTERHGGGRIALGRQLTYDTSVTLAYRIEDVRIRDPIVPPTASPGIPELNEVLGSSTLHGIRLQLTRDTRDNMFLPTEGNLFEIGVEQVLGTFQYPRGDIDLRKYFLIRQHPDGSGRHVLSLTGRMAITGGETPIYEHYFAGGFTTLRGFSFRGASPRDPAYGVSVGGHFSLLASAEYMFPITADDTLRGVVFCDSGVVQPSIDDWRDRYRVAPGFGLRITVPAMGPAPIALDFAFPVSTEPGDDRQVFSFFIGFLR
ncbi:MAG: POTRA domain-containing protein [Thermoguttaceae bacterium]